MAKLIRVWDGTTWQEVGTASAVGAQGATGVPGASPIFTYQGPIATYIGKTRYYFDYSRTISKIRVSVGTAPTGAGIVVTVYKNNISIGTTTIADGSFTGTSTPATAVVNGDYITASITQVGSTISGSDLTVIISVE